MNTKQIGALLLAMITIAGMALAAKPVGAGPDAGIDLESDLNELDKGRPGTAGPPTDLPTAEDGNNDTGIKEREEKMADIAKDKALGQLISVTNKVRQEMFTDLHTQLKAAGYKGPMDEFATGFNEVLKGLRTDIRNRLGDENSQFTKDVVREITERELARIREEKLAGIELNAGQAAEEVVEALNSEGEIDENALEEELAQMGKGFGAMVAEIAKNGSQEERLQLRNQIKAYLAEVKAAKEARGGDSEEVEESEIEDEEIEEEPEEIEEEETEAEEVEPEEAEDLNTA